jgi:hypothetical protein
LLYKPFLMSREDRGKGKKWRQIPSSLPLLMVVASAVDFFISSRMKHSTYVDSHARISIHSYKLMHYSYEHI